MTPELVFAPAAILALTGAVWDVRTRRIPNVLVIMLAVCAAGATLFIGGFSALGWTAVHAVIALLVGMGLFAVKAIGAGDAKFYAAAALAIPLDQALPMLGWTALSGLVLIVLMIAWHKGLKTVRDGRKVSWTLPYGLPICCGFLTESLNLARLPFM